MVYIYIHTDVWILGRAGPSWDVTGFILNPTAYARCLRHVLRLGAFADVFCPGKGDVELGARSHLVLGQGIVCGLLKGSSK